MYFRLGGGNLWEICRLGETVWSRAFLEDCKLKVDLGRAVAIELPTGENERRWRDVSYEWPVMHIVLRGVSQNQFMARHPANHVTPPTLQAQQVQIAPWG